MQDHEYVLGHLSLLLALTTMQHINQDFHYSFVLYLLFLAQCKLFADLMNPDITKMNTEN